MKMRMLGSRHQETIFYVVMWLLMFIVPVVSIQLHHAQDGRFPWGELVSLWAQVGNLLVAFLLHNFLLAPLLVYRQKRLLYFCSIAVLTGCFALLQCSLRPDFKKEGEPPAMKEHRPPMRHDDFDAMQSSDECFDRDDPSRAFSEKEDFRPHMRRPHHREGEASPPFFFGQHDMVACLILIMMLGMNVGVKLYFKQRKDQERLNELEKENLQQQLEYLRYQINPHFLMNTLNNIHALVDIDGERAKDTIVELSKIMRYALYEGARQRVPLGRDVEFLQSYVKLMRLRFTDKVDIVVDIPSELPEREIPPMIFITFVENAFKHGISYRQESFIHVRLDVQPSWLVFVCQNSKVRREPVKPGQELAREGGVGLTNVQRRLQLLYGDQYRLDIDDQAETYNITLEIPLS